MKATLALTALVLSGCTVQELGLAPAPDDPLYRALAGKTLTLTDQPDIQVTLGADGRMAGFATGTWRVADGIYCRTITAPRGMTGTECPRTEVDGETVTFTSSAGRSTWRIGQSTPP